MWPADIAAQVAAEFDLLPTVDPETLFHGVRVLVRSGRGPKEKKVYDRDERGCFVPGGNRVRRGKYAGHARDPRYVLMKRVALARLGGGESAREVARVLGVNRATVCRWAREAGLRLRRNVYGGSGPRKRSSVDWAASR